MPYVLPSQYIPPRFLTNGHVQTVFASVFRYVGGVIYRRERIETPDGDFLDIDWSEVGPAPIAILFHGLEGSSRQRYMLGMTRALNLRGINVVSVNLRGCSGELNRKLTSYHCGSTDDVDVVSAHVAALYPKTPQYLIGFSLGGNLVLKYLGERGAFVRPQIERGVAFSVPCDLESCASIVHSSSNRLYFIQFMLTIQLKLREKNRQFPGQINPKALEWWKKSFKELDDYFTAPVWGFGSAEHYWESASCKSVLANIKVPTLLVNAKDDPLIGQACFPVDIAAESSFLTLEIPEHGGHVGFVSFNAEGEYWSETRAANFVMAK